MASTKNETVIFAFKVIDLLVDRPLSGLSLEDVMRKTLTSRSTTHRTLKTLEATGWVEQIKTRGRAVNWTVSKRFLKAAHAHRKAVQSELERVQREYQDITGEVINHG